jgi:hypothetical protein
LDFLHPVVIESAYGQFRNGHLRDAVFNAFVAVFDLLRRRRNNKMARTRWRTCLCYAETRSFDCRPKWARATRRVPSDSQEPRASGIRRLIRSNQS